MTDARALSGENAPQRLSDLRQVLHGLPKADLHRHLEGSLRLSTLVEIAHEHGVDLPSYTIEDLRPYVQITNDPADFHRFLEKFRLLRKFYRTPDAVARVAYEAVADAAEDNVRYLELRFNPAALARTQGFSFSEVTDWVIEAVHRAQADYAITARLITTIVRHEGIANAREIVNIAIARQARGIVGVDLAGDEVNFDAKPFVPVFREAGEAGLGVTIHAGEAGGAENVRQAVAEMGAKRIGHGVRAIENSNVIKLLRERSVTLEVCPTSNLQTGVMHNFSHHPLRDLYMLGVSVTLNTDDPSVSDTTLTDEYLVALMAMGIRMNHLRRMNEYALRAAFLPEGQRQTLAEQVLTEFDRQLERY
ncbi:MAG TPA: adenosine deaminase [Anaerolineae bacterium]|nr:adenosine deaminase [Anaerolineae bacterium]